MYGAIVERVMGVRNAQESGTLLEGSWSETWHFLQLSPTLKRSVLTAVVNDVFGKYRT